MSSQVASLPNQDFVLELFERATQRRGLGYVGWGIAIGAHVLAAGLALGEARPVAAVLPPPLEIELAPPPPPPAPVADSPKEEERAPERPQVAKDGRRASPTSPSRCAAHGQSGPVTHACGRRTGRLHP